MRYTVKLKNIQYVLYMIIITSSCIILTNTDRIKPYGLRRTFEHGLGDRNYKGVPASTYQHMWPTWQREIWYTIGDWSSQESPDWIAYYSYPYVIWPNAYRYFGSPYYTRDQREMRRKAKIKPKKKYAYLNDDYAYWL